jgi:hypothetical protein
VPDHTSVNEGTVDTLSGEDLELMRRILVALLCKVCRQFGVKDVVIGEGELDEAGELDLRYVTEPEREQVRVWTEAAG